MTGKAKGAIKINVKYIDSVSEIVREVQKQTKRADKIRILQENQIPLLRGILMYMYDENHKCLLPEGAPPYREQDYPESQRLIHSNSVLEKMKAFYESGGMPNLKQPKREQIFIELCETLHKDDAKLLIDMKDRVKIRGITKKIVSEAFPGLISEEKKDNGKNIS